jgi:hypothetical protein
MIKNEPRMNITDLVGFLLIYLGLLFLLITLHLFTINSIGGTAEVLSVTFRVFLIIYMAAVTFGIVAGVIHLLRWLAWVITTPEWLKKQIRNDKI